MPFRKKAKITIENIDETQMTIYYQIDYTLTQVPEDSAYFHAQFRRENPLKTKGLYTILDGVAGQGQYVGTYLAWERTAPVGGVRVRSSSTSTAIRNSRLSVAPGRRIISAVPTTLRPPVRMGNTTTTSFPLPTPGWPRSFVRMVIRFPNPLRPLPVAYRRSCPVQQRPQSHHPGPRLDEGRALPTASRRHRFGRVLVQTEPHKSFPNCRARTNSS